MSESERTDEKAQPPFVRSLPAGGVVSDEPLALTSEAQERLDEQTTAMRNARDAAAVTGRDYLIHGLLSPEAQEVLAEVDRGDLTRMHRLMDEDPLPDERGYASGVADPLDPTIEPPGGTHV